MSQRMEKIGFLSDAGTGLSFLCAYPSIDESSRIADDAWMLAFEGPPSGT